MQRTVNFLCKFFGYAFNTGQLFNAGARHTPQAAKTLQQTCTFARPHTGDVF